MTTAEAVVQAIWESATRTLATGSPAAPTNQLEQIVAGIWAYTGGSGRTLSGGGGATPLAGEQLSSALFACTRPDVGMGLSGVQSAVASFGASEIILRLGFSGSEQSVAALSGILSLYSPQVSIQGAIVTSATLSGSIDVFSSQKALAGALNAVVALNAGPLSVQLSLTGNQPAIARFAGALRIAGITVDLVWSARGESAEWDAYGEWYDPTAATTTTPTETDGEILN